MKPVHCIVCDASLAAPLLISQGHASLTTMLDVLPDPTVVRFCDRCGHLQTDPLPDLTQYYAQHYQILANSEDEDQLVSLRDGRNVLRNQLQTDTLVNKITLIDGAAVLDYGCAKSAVLRQLLTRRPDISPHVFDVNDLYVPFWRKFIPEGQWATHQVPAQWAGRFEVVTSFFALEHVEAPRQFIQEVGALLKPNGLLYGIVPNAYDNVADFVVADHVSHFSATSITFLLESNGFAVEQIDGECHPGAWVFVGRKAANQAPPTTSPVAAQLKQQAARMAAFWASFGDRVREFEDRHAGKSSVVYGSGFYAMYLMTCLRQPERVVCFLDQNPHRQRQQLLGRAIRSPGQVPAEASTLYVGLNPRIAKSAMAAVPALNTRPFDFFYP
jgi:SAM-dependent methyltransferase